MQINLAQSAGFCFGVRRAIKIARGLAQTGKDICMLGDLVHNETVIREMQALGLKKIRKLGSGRNRTLLIRAHGVSADLLLRARRRGYTLVDATCPMVREIHRIVKRMDRLRYRLIVIGDRRHEEVLGIVGQIKRRALVLDPSRKFDARQLRGLRRAAVVVQSTQNLDQIIPIVEGLKQKIPRLEFFNTICMPTRAKQAEIKVLPTQNDVMIIIGSRTSANTKRLYEISKSLNSRSHWIESAAGLEPRWFTGARAVGVTAGASTPESTTQAVISRINQLSGQA